MGPVCRVRRASVALPSSAFRFFSGRSVNVDQERVATHTQPTRGNNHERRHSSLRAHHHRTPRTRGIPRSQFASAAHGHAAQPCLRLQPWWSWSPGCSRSWWAHRRWAVDHDAVQRSHRHQQRLHTSRAERVLADRRYAGWVGPGRADAGWLRPRRLRAGHRSAGTGGASRRTGCRACCAWLHRTRRTRRARTTGRDGEPARPPRRTGAFR